VPSTPRTIDAGVRIGEIFVDKYRVDAILGHGGMGVVALCTHLALNERVAIKMLRRDVLDDTDAVERFMREAQAASKLRSEYVARVTDVGRSGANVPYMVMEYLEGHDLDELLEERGTIQRPLAVELTLQVCEALAEAHSLGIVHRDIKPSNLFVTWRPDGSALIKVLDFGIAKALIGDVTQLTQTQSLLGTPAYMSPEQMRSARHVDARTDIWSLGTVLFEMLEGRRPFEAESFSEMCVKVAVDPPGPMPNTPPGLHQVVLRCLAKPPEQRYASMADLGRDLVPFSRDPHQAHVLAERMARTLRRSQVIDWEPVVAELPSPPRPAPVLAPGAAPPIAQPVEPTAATEPAIAAPFRVTPSAAAQSLSTTYRIPRPARKKAIIVGAVLVVAAAAIGVAVSQTRQPAHVAPSARQAEPSPVAAPSDPAAAPIRPVAEGSATGARVGTAAPEASASGRSAPGTAASDTAKSDTAKSGTAKSDTAKSDTAASNPAASEPGASDTAASDTAASDTAASDTAGPDDRVFDAPHDRRRTGTGQRPPRPKSGRTTGRPRTVNPRAASPNAKAVDPGEAPEHNVDCAFDNPHGTACPPAGSNRRN
jgi:tRNA A-37 threonylcarbamoyl transferase component Bud32